MRDVKTIEAEMSEKLRQRADLQRKLTAVEEQNPQIQKLCKQREVLRAQMEVEPGILKFIPPLKTCIILWVVCTVVSGILIPSISVVVSVLLLVLTAAGIVLRKTKGSDAAEANKKIEEINVSIKALVEADPQMKELKEAIRALDKERAELGEEKTQLLFQSKLGKNNIIIFADPDIYDGDSCYIKSGVGAGSVVARLKIDGNEMGIIGKPCRIAPLTPGIHSISLVVTTGSSSVWTTHDQQFSVNDSNVFYVFKAYWDSAKNLAFKLEKYTEMSAFLKESKITKEAFTEFVVTL